MNTKQLRALVEKAKKEDHKRDVMKKRVAFHNFLEHAKTCAGCRMKLEAARNPQMRGQGTLQQLFDYLGSTANTEQESEATHKHMVH